MWARARSRCNLSLLEPRRIPTPCKFCASTSRQIPEHTVEFEHVLDASLSAVLNDLSAPQRVLVIDAADAVDEGMEAAFCNLVDAAQASDMKVVAVAGMETRQVVHDALVSRLGTEVSEACRGPAVRHRDRPDR